MVLTKSQQARLFALANGASLPQAEAVRPRVADMGGYQGSMTVNVVGRLNGNDMELMGANTRGLARKIGKRYS